MKRKNGRKSRKCEGVNSGVDLNRNYDISWESNPSYDKQECGATFRGPSPFSEPETRTMRDFILANADTLKFIVNYHSYGNIFLVPYSGNNTKLKLTAQ